MALLELELLFERREITDTAKSVLLDLADRIDLKVSGVSLESIVAHARTFARTRDPFDRLIVANALADGARLVAADTMILDNFADAVW